jgi:hypothetical protein
MADNKLQERLQSRSKIVISSKDDAETVVKALIEIIDRFSVVLLGDLYDLVGLPTVYVDHKWGWTNLSNVEIKQVDNGYLIDLPPLEAIDE